MTLDAGGATAPFLSVIAAAERLDATGRPLQADVRWREAVLLARPGDPSDHAVLAHGLGRARRWRSAAEIAGRAGAQGWAEAPAFQARALFFAGAFAEALALFDQALALAPLDGRLHSDRGCALQQLGRWDEAEAALRRGLELDPGHAANHNNLGLAFRQRGRLDDALACFERAVELDAGYVPGQFNRALILLANGDFARGWEGYEWRWRLPHWQGHPIQTWPRWTGEPTPDKTVLLLAEQGFGDTLQFVRYAPMAATRVGNLVLSVQPSLVRLLQAQPGLGRVVADNAPGLPFDLCCPMLSLPRAFGTDAGTIPADVPYLRSDPAAAAAWRSRLDAALGPGLRVGLVWAGRSERASPETLDMDADRSVPLRILAPLLATPGVAFVSVQTGPAAAEARTVPGLLDLTADLRDFAETAALLDGLDLVIAVDTAVAHLAGAMAKPVWVLSRFDGCWRWLRDRRDSPWYPTLRLFRQSRPGDWAGVVAEVAAELARLTESSAPRP